MATKRADGRYVATATLDLPEGRKRVFAYGRTQREANAALAERRRLALAHIRAAERLTVGGYLAEWLDRKAGELRPSGWRYYERVVRLYLVPALGDIRLHALAPHRVRAMLDGMDGKSPRTRAMAHATLRAALNDAVRDDLLARNVAAAVRPPRQERATVTALDATEVSRLLDATASDRLAAAYVVAALCGLRQGELLGLRWPNVDVGGGTLDVAGTLAHRDGAYVLDAPKTERSRRTVALPALAVDALRAHRVRQVEERLAAGRRWLDNDLVFTTPIGAPVSGTWLTHALQRHCERAGLPRIRFHDLRHTAASLMLQAGVAPRVVMEQLGHSSIVLTMDTYSHVSPFVQRDAADRIDVLLSRR